METGLIAVPGLGGMMMPRPASAPPAPPIPSLPPALQELIKGGKCGSCNPCDPKCLPPVGQGPNAAGVPPLNVPNKGILPTRAWVALPSTGYPSVVVPLGTQTAPIFFAAKRTTANGETDLTVLGRDAYTWPRGGILFAPGQWYAYNSGTADLEVVIREYACAEEAALAMAGIQIVGTNGGAAAVGDFHSTTADERLLALFVRAGMAAQNPSQAAGSRSEPLLASAMSSSVSVDEARVALIVQAALRALDSSQAANARNVLLVARGAVADQSYGLERLLVDGVVRGDDGTDYPAISGGTLSAMDHSVTSAVRGLYAIAALSLINVPSGRTHSQANAIEENASLTQAFSGVVEGRGGQFLKSLRGRAFRVGSDRALVQGIAAFVATTPDVLIVPAATNEWVLKKLRVWTLTQTGTVRVRVVYDPDNRFSAGGTTRTPVNRNLGSAATDTPTRCLDGGPVGAATPITATAEDADERGGPGDKFITAAFGEAVFERDDGDIVSPAGSTLLYVNDNAGAVAPTFGWEAEYELADVQ